MRSCWASRSAEPGAGWGAKRWPSERYGAVAAELHAEGFTVLVNAGPNEKEIAAEVVRASGGVARAPDFTTPNSTLERLIALTRRVSLVIAGDTGPLHLACALGKPVVGIYGPTDPKRNGPFGVPFRVLRHPKSKRDHSRLPEDPETGAAQKGRSRLGGAPPSIPHHWLTQCAGQVPWCYVSRDDQGDPASQGDQPLQS